MCCRDQASEIPWVKCSSILCEAEQRRSTIPQRPFQAWICKTFLSPISIKKRQLVLLAIPKRWVSSGAKIFSFMGDFDSEEAEVVHHIFKLCAGLGGLAYGLSLVTGPRRQIRRSSSSPCLWECVCMRQTQLWYRWHWHIAATCRRNGIAQNAESRIEIAWAKSGIEFAR